MRKFITVSALALLISMPAYSDQDQAKDEKKELSFKITIYGPDGITENVGPFGPLKKLYQEALPLVNDWLPGRREKGLDLLREAAKGGYFPAKMELGQQIALYPDLVPESLSLGIALMKTAAGFGEPRAQLVRGLALIDSGQEQKGIALIEKAIQKSPEVQGLYGQMLLGAKKDEASRKKGWELVNKAIEAGDPETLIVFGRAYILGKGVTKDEEKGIRYLQEAAEKGNLQAKWMSAYISLFEKKGPVSIKIALQYLAQSVGDKTGLGAYYYGLSLSVGRCNSSALGAAWMVWGMKLAEKTGLPFIANFKQETELAVSRLTDEERIIYEQELKREYPSFASDDTILCIIKSRTVREGD